MAYTLLMQSINKIILTFIVFVIIYKLFLLICLKVYVMSIYDINTTSYPTIEDKIFSDNSDIFKTLIDIKKNQPSFYDNDYLNTQDSNQQNFDLSGIFDNFFADDLSVTKNSQFQSQSSEYELSNIFSKLLDNHTEDDVINNYNQSQDKLFKFFYKTLAENENGEAIIEKFIADFQASQEQDNSYDYINRSMRMQARQQRAFSNAIQETTNMLNEARNNIKSAYKNVVAQSKKN